jgi:hypothetical protein
MPRPPLQPCSACHLPRRPVSAEAIDDQYEIASMKCLRCDTVVLLVRHRPLSRKPRALRLSRPERRQAS